MPEKFEENAENPDEKVDSSPESIEYMKELKRTFIRVASALKALAYQMHQEYKDDVSPNPEIAKFLLTESTDGIKNITLVSVLLMRMKKNELTETGTAKDVSLNEFIQIATELMKNPQSLKSTAIYQETLRSFLNPQT